MGVQYELQLWQSGRLPATQLRDYVAMLVQYTRIPLAILSPYHTEHQKSPFAQQPWETGSLLLKFLVGGAERSRWEDFRAQRKILGRPVPLSYVAGHRGCV